jgi:hypothetical protein
VTAVTRRTLVLFWTAVAVSVLLIGAGVSSLRRVLGAGGGVDLVLLIVAAAGAAVALFVAGRIVFVSARR